MCGTWLWCGGGAHRGVLQELDSVVTRARMFRCKPDGEVSLTKSQDAVGLPAPLMQDPIHYPHGTKFMAPGANLLSSRHIHGSTPSWSPILPGGTASFNLTVGELVPT